MPLAKLEREVQAVSDVYQLAQDSNQNAKEVMWRLMSVSEAGGGFAGRARCSQ